jgi:outer membrane protein W
MFVCNKIYASILALSLPTSVSICGYAQSKAKNTSKAEKQPITIGFQTGRELLFNSSPLIHSKQSKVHYSISKSLVLRKALTPHFKIETGLKYTALEPAVTNPIIFPGKLNNKPYGFSLPVTIQYYLLSDKYRLRPFCGAGFQCNFFESKNNQPSMQQGMDAMPQYYNPQNDTKYITILFTQGVTFEVNTKIEISQSFHFIPENANNIIGIDLGIGFKIP